MLLPDAIGSEFVSDSTKLCEMASAPFCVLHVSHGAGPCPAAHREGDLIKLAGFSRLRSFAAERPFRALGKIGGRFYRPHLLAKLHM